MKSVFSQDGILWRVLNCLTDVFVLSLLFLLCCIPLVTAGASLTALYDSAVRCIRYKESGPYRRFFATFREELKNGIFMTLLWGAAIGAVFFGRGVLKTVDNGESAVYIAYACWYAAGIIPMGIACWVFPVMSRFSQSFGRSCAAAFKLCLGRLPRTVVLILLASETISLCIKLPFLAAFLPAAVMLLASLFIEPVFAALGGAIHPAGKE